MNYKKYAKITLAFTYISLVLLFLFAIFLPFLVSWYVETKGRDASLPTTLLLVTYPAIPFVAAIILSLRKILKNILQGLIFGDENVKMLSVISVCSLLLAVVFIFFGHRYLPYYVAGILMAGISLIVFTFRTMFDCCLQLKRERENKDIIEFYENQNK